MTVRDHSFVPYRLSQVFLVLWLGTIPFSTTVSEILLGLAVLAVLTDRLLPPGERGGWAAFGRGGPATRPVPVLWLALILLYLVSVLAAVDPVTSQGRVHKLFRYALLFTLLGAPFGEAAWRWLFRSQAVVLVVLIAMVVPDLHFGWGRAQTANLHYNTMAQEAGLISLLLLAAAVYGPGAEARQRRERWVLAIFSLLAAGLLAVTLSRAAWLGWLSGVALVLALSLRRRLVLLVLAVVVVLPIVLVPSVRWRLGHFADFQDPEFTRRFDMWRMGADIIRDFPLTGIGPGGIDAVYHQYKTGVLIADEKVWPTVHNDVLQVGLSHGLPAIAVWLALICWLYRALGRRLRRFRDLPGSWTKAGFAGAAMSIHLFYVCGLMHDNYVIYFKICVLLFLWGSLVGADRRLGPLPAAGGPAGGGGSGP